MIHVTSHFNSPPTPQTWVDWCQFSPAEVPYRAHGLLGNTVPTAKIRSCQPCQTPPPTRLNVNSPAAGLRHAAACRVGKSLERGRSAGRRALQKAFFKAKCATRDQLLNTKRADCYRKRPLPGHTAAPGALLGPPDTPARLPGASLPQRETPNAVRLRRNSHVRTGRGRVTCGSRRHGGADSYTAAAAAGGSSLKGYNSTAPGAGCS